jgi:hypothetical protein
MFLAFFRSFFFCRNSLIDKPFAPLIQDYQQCNNDPTMVFFTQVGAALGNLSVIIPVAIVVTLLLLYFYQSVTGDMIPRTYSKEERETALNALAVSLLLKRDYHRSEVERYQEMHQKLLNLSELNSASSTSSSSALKNDMLTEVVKALHYDSEYHSNAHYLNHAVNEIISEKKNRTGSLKHAANAVSHSDDTNLRTADNSRFSAVNYVKVLPSDSTVFSPATSPAKSSSFSPTKSTARRRSSVPVASFEELHNHYEMVKAVEQVRQEHLSSNYEGSGMKQAEIRNANFDTIESRIPHNDDNI